jgi:sulfur carrier protein
MSSEFLPANLRFPCPSSLVLFFPLDSCNLMGDYVYMSSSLMLEINGEIRAVPPVANVRDLIEHLKVSPDRIAVELNHNIIRRKDWEATPVGDHDRVEIVQFVGGG